MRKLQEQFECFYVNTYFTAKGTQKKRSDEQMLSEDFTFRPQLSQRSMELAAGSRQKQTGMLMTHNV